MMRRQWRRQARERRPMARQRGFRSAPRLFAKESCGAGTVSQKEMRRNEGPVPFISSGGYRACAFWRKALIG